MHGRRVSIKVVRGKARKRTPFAVLLMLTVAELFSKLRAEGARVTRGLPYAAAASRTFVSLTVPRRRTVASPREKPRRYFPSASFVSRRSSSSRDGPFA